MWTESYNSVDILYNFLNALQFDIPHKALSMSKKIIMKAPLTFPPTECHTTWDERNQYCWWTDRRTNLKLYVPPPSSCDLEADKIPVKTQCFQILYKMNKLFCWQRSPPFYNFTRTCTLIYHFFTTRVCGNRKLKLGTAGFHFLVIERNVPVDRNYHWWHTISVEYKR